MKKTLNIYQFAGSFAENKDTARMLRQDYILPILEEDAELVLDFDSVEDATQSFVHALISQAIRQFGPNILNRIYFKNCNSDVQKIISIVVEYMQGNMDKPIS